MDLLEDIWKTLSFLLAFVGDQLPNARPSPGGESSPTGSFKARGRNSRENPKSIHT